ncbi:MAG: hypothetical protein RL757_1396, partial [Bacteroidota bacterium]
LTLNLLEITMKKIFLIFYLLFLPFLKEKMNAQSGLQIVTTVHYGKMAKHSKKILFTPPPPSIATEIRAEWQLGGQKIWHEWTGFPRVGVGVLRYHLGDHQIFGDAYAVFPTLNLKLFGGEKWRMNYVLGSGVGYLTKRFNPIENPTFNAIGSHLNNITTMRFDVEHKYSKKLAIFGGLSLTHFSNGGSQLPNSGINLIGGNVGCVYALAPVEKKSWLDWQRARGIAVIDTPRNVSRRRWGASVRFDVGYTESSTWGGPRLPIYMASAALIRNSGQTRRTHLGIEAEQNQAVYHFYQDVRATDDKGKDQIGANRLSVFAAEEFVFGNFSIYLQPTFYVSQSWSNLLQGRFYNKLGFRVFTPEIGKQRGQLFGGIYIKAHMFTAEYISLGGGAIF